MEFWLIIIGLTIFLSALLAYFFIPDYKHMDMPANQGPTAEGQYNHEDDPEHFKAGEMLEVYWELDSSIYVGIASQEDAEAAGGNLSKLRVLASAEGKSGRFFFTAPKEGKYCVIIAKMKGVPTGMINMDKLNRQLTVGHVLMMLIGVIIMIYGAVKLAKARGEEAQRTQAMAQSTGYQQNQQYQQGSQEQSWPTCPACNVYLDQYRTCPNCGVKW